MIVKLNGEELDVVEGLTFAELIDQVRGLLDDQVLVELRLNRETVSQSLLDELKDQPIYGEIELFSLDVRGLIKEVVERALQYLEQLEGLELGPREVPELLKGFEWLNRALALIPLGIGFPELQVRVEQLLRRNLQLREQLSNSPEGSIRARSRLMEEWAAYRAVFREIGERL